MMIIKSKATEGEITVHFDDDTYIFLLKWKVLNVLFLLVVE